MPQSDERHEASAQGTDESSLEQIVSTLAWAIARLDPGSAAALRRGPLTGAGAAAFWKLTAEHAPRGARNNEAGWAALLQAIAILTPKGAEANRRPAYEPTIRMGAALCDAGVSELRLARLLSAPKEMRRDLAVRLCRRLSATEYDRFDLRTLARLILVGDDKTNRRIARDYYRAQAKNNAQQSPDESEEQEAPSNA